MRTALSPAKVHRLRRIVGWLAVLLLGLALATAALALTRHTRVQCRPLVSGHAGIEAALHGETPQRFTALHRGEHRQALFDFELPGGVAPEWQSPVGRSPFGN
jgi:hypothetical protein